MSAILELRDLQKSFAAPDGERRTRHQRARGQQRGPDAGSHRPADGARNTRAGAGRTGA